MTSIPLLRYVTLDKLLLVILVAFLPFLIILGKKLFRSFQLARKLPGPSLWEILSVHREALLGPGIVACLSELTSRYDYKPWSLWSALHHITVISDPETIGEAYKSKNLSKEDKFYNGLAEYLGPNSITLNGPKWKVRRNIINPVLNKTSIEHNLDVVNEEADRLTQDVNRKSDGTDLDIHCYITKTLVRSSIRSLLDREPELTEEVVHEIYWAFGFATSMVQINFTNPLGYFLQHYFQKETKDAVTKYNRVIDEAMQIIRHGVTAAEKHVSENADQETPLQALVVASVQKNILTEKEMYAELLALLAASVETTSTVMSGALCMLALHPEIQRKVRDEIKSVFRDSNRPASPEDLRHLEYLECVIKEAMRLYPPGAFVPRSVNEDAVINGTFVPKGSTMVYNVFALHRSPDIYKDPLKFDPDRFTPGAQEGRHPYAYLPFSAGARNCVGRLHAMMTMKIMLSRLLMNHEFLPASGIKNVWDYKVDLNFSLHICNPYVRVVPVNDLQ